MCDEHKSTPINCNLSVQIMGVTSLLLAEKERFELSKPFWGLHDFQSCALDQARRLLHDRS